jgi:cob(I)alamin adenosyltransferase
MNKYIQAQIKQMQDTTELFLNACKLAAEQDDGKTDRAEERQLKKIEKAVIRFNKELEAIK